MKNRYTTLTLALSGFALFAPVLPAQQAPAADTPAVKVWQEFMNLPEETRVEFNEGAVKAQNMFIQKRIFDTLQKAVELDSIFPDHPIVLNIKGGCYVELRDFPKAKETFEKILKMSPKNASAKFNLAEIEFVMNSWQSAHDQFTSLLEILKNNNKDIQRLCEFKILLCKIKLGQIEEAKAMRDKYDNWDDSPFYYYSRAAIYDHEGKKKESNTALKECFAIWKNPAALASWQDTVMEYGLLPSLFSEDPTKTPDSQAIDDTPSPIE